MSISIVVVLISMAAIWLNGMRDPGVSRKYGKASLYLGYACSRGIPLLMELLTADGMNTDLWVCVLFDVVFYAFLLQWAEHRGSDSANEGAFLYAFTPTGILIILSGKPALALIVPLAAFALVLVCSFSEKASSAIDRVFHKVYPAYTLFSLGSSLAICALQLGQRFDLSETITSEHPPMLLALSVLVVAASVVWGIRLATGVDRAPGSFIAKHFSVPAKDLPRSGRKSRLLALAVVIVITCAYALLVFHTLGSTRFPNSAYTLDVNVNTNQIDLDLGGRRITGISVCLGRTSTEFTFSVYNEKTEKWDAFDEKHAYQYVYAWETAQNIPDRKIGRLGLRLEDGVAYIQELILLDENGDVFLPLNASDYPELFDEQDTYTTYNTYFERTMFDEVYYTRTAREILEHDTIYETSHPPFGKDLFALATSFLGNNPFGWRFVSALCGILSIPLIYGLAAVLTRKEWYGVLAAVLHCAEFMHMTLSRICTIDIVVTLFILAMFFFMACFCVRFEKNSARGWWYLLPCGISMGMAIATKWTGFYAALGIAVMFFYTLAKTWGSIPAWPRKRAAILAVVCVVCFVVIPAVIYVCSYITYAQVVWDNRGLLEIVTSNFKTMLSYHSDTIFEHPYSSEWYTWPLDITSLMDSLTYFPDGKISLVVTFGNPLIFWLGMVAFLVCCKLAFKDKDKEAMLLLIMYLSMLVPWWFIKRTVFIYQYYVDAQLLTVLLAYIIACLNNRKARVIASCGVAAASMLLLLLFYPILAGIPVSGDYIRQLDFITKTWRFGV